MSADSCDVDWGFCGKAISVPEDSEQDRSKAKLARLIVEEVIGIVKRKLVVWIEEEGV